MIKIKYFPQTEVKQWNRINCIHQVTQNPASPDECKKPCKHKARYMVDGKPLCQLHAGYECLVFCLEENKKENEDGRG